MKIAFVLLPYGPDEPAGIERSVAALAAGLRARGHRAIIIAAGPPTSADDADLVRLDTIELPRPMLFDDLPRLLTSPAALCGEVERILVEHDIDLVCWTDAVAGLGYLAPAPAGVRTVLMAHLIRADASIHESLAHKPDAVLAVSPFVIEEHARVGVDTRGWQVLPNPLPRRGTPPSRQIREWLRLNGPIRTLTRADPVKGMSGLLRSLPPDLGRPVQIALADAAFELWDGMQQAVRDECLAIAEERPEVEILPAMPWDEAQGFLAGAALAMVPSVWPETFGNVAAEALSVGTPVAGFQLGNLPVLVGGAGCLVELDRSNEVQHIGGVTDSTAEPPGAPEAFTRLWSAATNLLADHDAYHAASDLARDQVQLYEPALVADIFLSVIGTGHPDRRVPIRTPHGGPHDTEEH
ncbi:glycosyltransferase family 4 protein [Nocardia sp. NPDC088792]|uniref:glycosyltransferase family 4 protein n=1 Tax=Nocardia sp. NPDC088792 TaxID=3364332 RepID=UPI003802A40F